MRQGLAMHESNYSEIPNSSTARITQQIATTKKECSRLQPSKTGETLHLLGGRVDSVAGREAGIDWHGASRSAIQGVTVQGYPIGVRHTWSMNATVEGVATFDCPRGFVARSGRAAGYPDSSHHADSQSNLMVYRNTVYNAPDDGIVGYEIDGSCHNRFEFAVAQGTRCQTAWRIHPRQRGSQTMMRGCWLEITEGCDTAIYYDGQDSDLIVDGLRFHKKRAPGVVIDMSGAKHCALTVRHCWWDVMPRVRMHRSCERLIRVEPRQGFTRRQFMDAIEWVG